MCDNTPPGAYRDGIIGRMCGVFSLIEDNVLLSDVTLRMATEGAAMVHNLIRGALTCVGDGTDIVFDRDYFGDHRGLDVMPGPFASDSELARPLW